MLNALRHVVHENGLVSEALVRLNS
jgi:hypothetical protein